MNKKLKTALKDQLLYTSGSLWSLSYDSLPESKFCKLMRKLKAKELDMFNGYCAFLLDDLFITHENNSEILVRKVDIEKLSIRKGAIIFANNSLINDGK